MANKYSFNMLQYFCLYSLLVLVGDHNVAQDTGVQYEGGDGVDLESYKCLGNLERNQGTPQIFGGPTVLKNFINVDSDPKLWYESGIFIHEMSTKSQQASAMDHHCTFDRWMGFSA